MPLRSTAVAAAREKPCASWLIASTAIRGGATILHNDTDFDVLARHTEL